MYHPRFKGTHYEIGLKFGERLRKQNVDLDSLIKLDTFQLEHGRRSLAILEEISPAICAEMQGLAEGIRIPFERLAAWFLCMGCCYDPKGCTTLCFVHDGNVYFGRNNDLPPFLKKNSMSAFYRLDNGFSFIGNTSSMITMEEGFNEHGLVVAMEFVFPTCIRPGINSVLLVRHLLETCRCVDEVEQNLTSTPIASACNIIAVDRTGAMAVMECTPHKVVARRPQQDESFLVSANHFTSPEMQCINPNSVYASKTRYDTAYSTLQHVKGRDGKVFTKEILSGKHGFMCQYDRSLNFETIWSTVIDLSHKQIFVAEGDPARAAYKEDTRPTLLFQEK